MRFMGLIICFVQTGTLDEGVECCFVDPLVYTTATFATSKVARSFLEPMLVQMRFILLLRCCLARSCWMT